MILSYVQKVSEISDNLKTPIIIVFMKRLLLCKGITEQKTKTYVRNILHNKMIYDKFKARNFEQMFADGRYIGWTT